LVAHQKYDQKNRDDEKQKKKLENLTIEKQNEKTSQEDVTFFLLLRFELANDTGSV